VDALTQAPPSSRVARGGLACLAAGVLALAWLAPASWPGGFWPAWPSVSLGLLACLLARWQRGGALRRALGSISGFLAVSIGGAQIAVLWLVALLTP
jgi:hypothetical protein